MQRRFSKVGQGALARGTSEVVIVVLGILIAFGLDAWWDSRSDARWERTQLDLLREEARANLRHLDEVISTHRQIATDVQAIIEFASQYPQAAVAEFPDSKLTPLIAWRTSEVSTGTLDALLAAGDLGRLQNPELRKHLAAWPALLLDVQEAEILARDFVEFVLTPALVGQGVLVHAHAARPGRGVAASAGDASVSVTATSQLLDLAAVRLSHEYIAIDSLLDLQEKLRQIESMLEEELAAG